MKIGDVAARTSVAPRMIRYYEQQGLLAAPRAENGYRTYTDEDVDRVARIAALVHAGVTTRLVKVLLDAEAAAARGQETCPLAVAEQLAGELAGLESRIACLTRSRDTIRDFLLRTEHEVLLREGGAAGA